ncbi:MAG: hypothetical protein HY238_13285 [Acidobacteria bacterium]|nr:hypothetical protein [Acidobacteriota bacterium]
MAAVLAVCAALAEELPTTVFAVREGLHASVSRIVADSKGFVWLPGPEGLARFDGNGFRIFTLADGLPPGVARDILERADGTYWVAVQDRLCLFDPRPVRQRFQCESPRLGAISQLLEDDRGLWCGTETGLWRRAAKDQKRWDPVGPIEPAAPNRSTVVHRLLKDARGDLWAATNSALYRFRRQGRVDRWTAADGLASDPLTALSETPNAIWAGAQTELLRLVIDPATGEARIAARYNSSHGLPSGYVVDVRSWSGEVWAATFRGLARQLPSGRWQAVELHPSLTALPLESLATDSLGHLWVGTTGGGAARISGSGFSRFSERDGLGVRRVFAIFEDRKGELIAVTKDENHYSLSRFDGYGFHAMRPYAPFGIKFGWSWSHIVVNSRSGDWWLGTGLGILHYRKQLTVLPVRMGREAGLPLGNMRVFEDSRGVIWASVRAVSDNRLYRREPGAIRFERLDESHGLPPLHLDRNCPVAFAEDGSGQVWIGMLDGGLVRFRDGKFQQFPPSSGAPDQGVRALLIDRQGRLWIGSRRQGLLRVDAPDSVTPVFSAYTKANGLSSNNVLALAEDLGGRIYAAGGSGIDRLDPATGRVRPFTSADGLPPGEFRVATRDRHGTLWFGGDQGLVRLQPHEDRRDPPDVLIYSIRVNGQDRPLSDIGDAEPAALSLGANERQVQVEFGGFRHDLLYQTRLSGVDQDWTPPSASRSVHYLSLAAGSYELAIRAVTPEGSVSSRPARVRFQIVPPVWQRWWFLLAVAAAGGSLIAFWHRSRLERHLAIERVRSRIATDLHDDIGASLSRIAMISEVLKIQPGSAHPDSSRLLGEIADTARSLVEDMSDIVWSIDPRRDTLGDLVSRLRAFGFGVLEPLGIRWTFEAPEEALSRRLSPDQRRQLYLILKEALHNIARHSQAANATVRIGFDGRSLCGEIEDDGCGCRPDGPQGLGIRSMRERAELLGGELEVQARPPGGTRVSLRFPLRVKDA